MFLQKDAENPMDRKCEQQICLNENGNGKKYYTFNKKETVEERRFGEFDIHREY